MSSKREFAKMLYDLPALPDDEFELVLTTGSDLKSLDKDRRSERNEIVEQLRAVFEKYGVSDRESRQEALVKLKAILNKIDPIPYGLIKEIVSDNEPDEAVAKIKQIFETTGEPAFYRPLKTAVHKSFTSPMALINIYVDEYERPVGFLGSKETTVRLVSPLRTGPYLSMPTGTEKWATEQELEVYLRSRLLGSEEYFFSYYDFIDSRHIKPIISPGHTGYLLSKKIDMDSGYGYPYEINEENFERFLPTHTGDKFYFEGGKGDAANTKRRRRWDGAAGLISELLRDAGFPLRQGEAPKCLFSKYKGENIRYSGGWTREVMVKYIKANREVLNRAIGKVFTSALLCWLRSGIPHPQSTLLPICHLIVTVKRNPSVRLNPYGLWKIAMSLDKGRAFGIFDSEPVREIVCPDSVNYRFAIDRHDPFLRSNITYERDYPAPYNVKRVVIATLAASDFTNMRPGDQVKVVYQLTGAQFTLDQQGLDQLRSISETVQKHEIEDRMVRESWVLHKRYPYYIPVNPGQCPDSDLSISRLQAMTSSDSESREELCTEWNDKLAECEICSEEMLTNQELAVGYCNHIFHTTCIDEYIKDTEPTFECPTCGEGGSRAPARRPVLLPPVTVRRIYNKDRNFFYSLDITADGKYIVTGQYERARVWNIESGQCVAVWTAPMGLYSIHGWNVAITPDGKWVVLDRGRHQNDDDYVVYAWNVESGEYVTEGDKFDEAVKHSKRSTRVPSKWQKLAEGEVLVANDKRAVTRLDSDYPRSHQMPDVRIWDDAGNYFQLAQGGRYTHVPITFKIADNGRVAALAKNEWVGETNIVIWDW